MRRVSTCVAATLVPLVLTACGGTNEEEPPTSTPSAGTVPTVASEPTPGVLSPDRFTDAYQETADVFALLSTQSEGDQPQTVAEANLASGLDDSTPLVFTVYTVGDNEGSSGSFCLTHTNGTFVAYTYTQEVGSVFLGDGPCSFESADASVVGDLSVNTWTKGGELMRPYVPTVLFDA